MEVLNLVTRRLLWLSPGIFVVLVLLIEALVYLTYIVPVGEQNGLFAALSAIPFVAILLGSLFGLTKVACSRPVRAWRAGWVN